MRFGLALAAAAWLLAPVAAHAACSCIVVEPRRALEASAAAFVGRVVSVTSRRLEDGRPVPGVRAARIVVTRALKGPQVGDTVAVEDAAGTCGLWFQPDSAWLVYAIEGVTKDAVGAPGPQLRTHRCTGTKPLRCAAPDLAALGTRPEPEAGDCDPARPPPPRRRAAPAPPAEPPDVALQLPSNRDAAVLWTASPRRRI